MKHFSPHTSFDKVVYNFAALTPWNLFKYILFKNWFRIKVIIIFIHAPESMGNGKLRLSP